MSSAEEKAKSGTAACSRWWPARWLCAGGVSRAQAASKGGEIAVGRGVQRVGGHEEQEGPGRQPKAAGGRRMALAVGNRGAGRRKKKRIGLQIQKI